MHISSKINLKSCFRPFSVFHEIIVPYIKDRNVIGFCTTLQLNASPTQSSCESIFWHFFPCSQAANVQKPTCICLYFLMKEWMHMWQMQSDVQGDIVFMEAPPFALLWFASGFIPVQDDIIVLAGRRKYCVKILHEIHSFARLHFSASHCHWIPQAPRSNVAHCAVFLFLVWLLFTVAIFCIARYLDMWPLCCVFACRSWTRLCLHATLHQQPGEGKLEKEKQKQEKHK